MTDWQPIETAPKDKAIWLWWPRYAYSPGDDPEPRMAKGLWKTNDRLKRAKESGEDIGDYEVSYFSDTWENDDYALAQREHAPTHWMPLPEPPTLGQKD